MRVDGIAAGGGFGFFSSSQKVHLRRWGGAVIGTTWENDIRHLCSLSIQLHLSGGEEHAVMARPPNEKLGKCRFFRECTLSVYIVDIIRGVRVDSLLNDRIPKHLSALAGPTLTRFWVKVLDLADW